MLTEKEICGNCFYFDTEYDTLSESDCDVSVCVFAAPIILKERQEQVSSHITDITYIRGHRRVCSHNRCGNFRRHDA